MANAAATTALAKYCLSDAVYADLVEQAKRAGKTMDGVRVRTICYDVQEFEAQMKWPDGTEVVVNLVAERDADPWEWKKRPAPVETSGKMDVGERMR